MLNSLGWVFREIFEGQPREATFLDDQAPALLDLLAALNAEQAGRPVCGDSLAAHTRHVLFSIGAYRKAIEFSDASCIVDDWPAWENFTVSEKIWQELLRELRAEAAAFVGFIDSLEPGSLNELQSRLLAGALAHLAFHLGAVQVKFDRLSCK